MCRHELRSRFRRVFSCGFPAVKKCSLCAPLLDTQGSICSPLTGYVTPLPNPTTYATKIGAKGTGRLIFDKIGSISTTPKRWLSEPKTKKSSQAAHVQYVVRRLTCIVSEVFFFFSLGAAPACPPGGAEASGEPEAVRRRDGGVHAPGEAKQNAVSLHSEMLRIIVPFGADCKEIMQSSPWLVTPGCVCVTPGAVCCYIRRHPCI